MAFIISLSHTAGQGFTWSWHFLLKYFTSPIPDPEGQPVTPFTHNALSLFDDIVSLIRSAWSNLGYCTSVKLDRDFTQLILNQPVFYLDKANEFTYSKSQNWIPFAEHFVFWPKFIWIWATAGKGNFRLWFYQRQFSSSPTMAADAQESSGDNSAIVYTFLRGDLLKIEGVVKTGEVAGIGEKIRVSK